jgi:hypothetical protein
MRTDDDAYLSRRISEERARALETPYPEVAAVHQALATLYSERLNSRSPNQDGKSGG